MKSLNSKAVSEIIGNLKILLIIAVTASFIFSYTYPSLINSENNVKIKSQEANFNILRNRVLDVSKGILPSASIKLALGGGSIDLTKNSAIYIHIYNESTDKWYNFTLGDITYSVGNKQISLEMCGVWEKYGYNNSVLIIPPSIYLRNKNIDINLVNMSFSGIKSISGRGIVFINILHRGFEVNSFKNVDINITVHSEYQYAWERYFENIGFKKVNSETFDFKNSNVTLFVGNVNVEVMS